MSIEFRIFIGIILALWFWYGIWFCLFVNRVFRENLDYLRKPNVNKMRNCPHGARYDAINLNRLKICLIGTFILPFRLIFGAAIAFSMHGLTYLVKTAYGGKLFLLTFSHIREQSRTKRRNVQFTGPIHHKSMGNKAFIFDSRL